MQIYTLAIILKPFYIFTGLSHFTAPSFFPCIPLYVNVNVLFIIIVGHVDDANML